MSDCPVVVNKYKESYDIYIGRGSYWGNPYTHIKGKSTKAAYIVDTREEAILKYKEYLRELYKQDKDTFMKELESLSGKTLGCFCKPKSCHGDTIVEVWEKLIGDRQC